MRWALFSVAGLSLLVALYYLGLTPVWARELKEAMASAPFLLPPDAPALSPGTGFLLCMALTLALVYDLLLIRGTLRKTAVLAVFLLHKPAQVHLLRLFFRVLQLQTEFYRKGRALVLFTLDTDLAAHHIYDIFRDRHTQSGALDSGLGGTGFPFKGFKYMIYKFR